MDNEKVIKGLENCIKYIDRACPIGCPYYEICTKYEGRFVFQPVLGDAFELLKEQEATKPKTGHWIFESAYCEAWSHTCSECGKRMSTAYNTYANYCWNCGAEMKGGTEVEID